MKDTILDANFPKTAEQRVYHLGIRPGEVANRIVTVGSPSRARGIANFLDAKPTPFELFSERGFLTITGRYNGVPISIISIGMGYPNMDFFVREVRESLAGDMVVVRVGSCGSLTDIPVGSIAVPKSSIVVTRNFDFDFVDGHSEELPYRVSNPVASDPDLHKAIFKTLTDARPSGVEVKGHVVNASADSFYSSQGRATSFNDHNTDLIDQLHAATPDLATLEMETFHLFHLAHCWTKRNHAEGQAAVPAVPLATSPVLPILSQGHQSEQLSCMPNNSRSSIIRAAAAHIIFASRVTQDFISPEAVILSEAWVGRGVLEALTGFHIDQNHLHADDGAVWKVEVR